MSRLSLHLQNHSLHALDASDRDLNGTEAQEIGVALAGNPWLTSLTLSSNDIGVAGARSIRDGLICNSSLRKLIFRESRPNIGYINIILEALEKNVGLRALGLSRIYPDAKCTQILADALAKNNTLQDLDISFNNMCLHAIGIALTRNTSLKKLNVSSHHMVHTGGIHAIANVLSANNSLECLDMSDGSIFPEGDEGLASARAFSESLRTNTSLRSLNLKSQNMRLEIMQMICSAVQDNSSISSLVLLVAPCSSQGAAEAIASMLRHNQCIEELILTQSHLCDKGTRIISEALKHNHTLRKIDLTSTCMKWDGLQAIAEALVVNSTLQTLILSRNNTGVEVIRALAASLKTNSALQYLSLTQCCICADGAAAIADALRTNTCLHTLEIDQNLIQAAGADAIKEAILNNTSLQALNLTECNLGEDGAGSMAHLLAKNTTLRTLKVADNSFGYQGTLAVIKALKKNRTLTCLDIAKQCGDEKEVVDKDKKVQAQRISAYVGDMLAVNTSLESLRFQAEASWKENGAKPGGGYVAFAEGLRKNTTLKVLEILCRQYQVGTGFYGIAAFMCEICKCAFYVCEVLQDTPRYHPLSLSCSTDRGTFQLADFAQDKARELGLPREADEWKDEEILAFYHDAHMSKVLALAMGLHVRLGVDSSIGALTQDAFACVCEVFFGLKIGCLDIRKDRV